MKRSERSERNWERDRQFTHFRVAIFNFYQNTPPKQGNFETLL